MAHSFLTDDVVSWKSLDLFENALAVLKRTNRRFEGIFGPHGGSNRSDTIRVRQPNFVTVRTGWTASWQDLDEQYVNLVIDKPLGVDIKLTDKEMAMDLTNQGVQIMKPVLNHLASQVDLYCVQELGRSPNYVGTPGTTPSMLSTYLDGQALLSDYGCPIDDEITVAVSPQMDVDIVDALKGLYHDDTSLKRQYLQGTMRKAAGLTWARTQQTRTHATGSAAGGGLVKGAAQSGASVVVDDYTVTQTGVLTQDDIVAFDGCYAVNPVTKASTGRLKTFRVIAAVSSDATGDATIPIEPAIVLTGPNKNVTAAPDDDGKVYQFGKETDHASTTARQGLMWHPLAIATAFQQLENPNGEGAKGRTVTDTKSGISIRYTRAWDIDDAVWKLRWDVFMGVKLIRPEWTLRVQSGS